MSPVERAARAMHASHGIMLPFDSLPKDTLEALLSHARAAIASLREPTEAMVEAGSDVDDAGGDFRVGQTAARNVFQAMIDVAIQEE